MMRFLAVVLLLVAIPLEAQEPRVRVQADTSVMSVGDRIVFTVAVEHAAADSVVWPDSLNLGPFEVVAAEGLPRQQVDDRFVTAARFALTAFELGELEIPSFALSVVRGDGTVSELSTDAWGIEVVTVGLDEGGEIRAIKGPLMIALTVISLLPWLILLTVVIAVLVWLWKRSHKRDVRELGPVEIGRPPHETAYAALERLEESGLLERDEVKEFHVLVSEIIRTYVEGRFRIYALEMTTADLVDSLWRVGIEGDLLDRFRMFLERADLVKFAKLRPSASRSTEMLEIARALIDDTRPRMMEFETDAAADIGEEE